MDADDLLLPADGEAGANPPNLGVLYRVEDRRYAGGTDEYGDPIPGDYSISIELYAVPIRKVTPAGWRLDNGKFVKREAHKRWACPTIDEAFVSFEKRKERQARILKAQIQDALEALNGARRLKDKIVQEVAAAEPRPWWRAHRRTNALYDKVVVILKPPRVTEGR